MSKKIVDDSYYNNMTLGFSSGNKTGYVNYKSHFSQKNRIGFFTGSRSVILEAE